MDGPIGAAVDAWFGQRTFLLDDFKSRMEAAVAAYLAAQWQPIETAPRDGTEVILRRDDRVTSGCWTEWTETEAEYHATTGVYLGQSIQGGGACWSSWDGGFVDEEPPTAWQPLPEPPKGAK